MPDDFADDLSIALRGQKGDTSVLFGCAHRGAINTLKRIGELWGVSKYDLVMGGMHLLMSSPEQVNKTLDALAAYQPGRLAVGHCTGDLVQLQIAQKFPGKFIFPASGLKIQIE
jgi:7,8-dihydropterin-6-yl-methyl-4-(beta-D-ribofuranosyl)aminobenzene 5'-phosphate synthase